MIYYLQINKEYYKLLCCATRVYKIESRFFYKNYLAFRRKVSLWWLKRLIVGKWLVR